jgi:hypothetical protein
LDVLKQINHLPTLQLDVTVDAGSDEKEPVDIGSTQASLYPVTTSSTSGGYKDVVIEFSQDCGEVTPCELAVVDFDFADGLPAGVFSVTDPGKIVLSGSYDAINEAMEKLLITPGSGNPGPINVKVTATDQDGVTSNFDSFTIPIVSVSVFIQICFCRRNWF